MWGIDNTRLVRLLQVLHRAMLRIFPCDFRAKFGEEMAQVFGERLAAAAEQGAWAVVVLCARELGQMPVALLRVNLYAWRKKRQRVRGLFSQMQPRSVFGAPPADADGRFSSLHLLLEVIPFLLTALVILLLTYRPPAWLPPGWRHPPSEAAAALWAGGLPALVLLVGLARGMPRWTYPYGGLVGGYTLWAAAGQGLVWLWAVLLAMAGCLAVMAAIVHRGQRPLPPYLRRLGASVALDWTRLSLGVFGAAPMLILAAFDNAYVNHSTPYLAVALLLMVLTVLAYARCRRQDRQLAILLGGTTLLFVPALLEHVTWRGGAGGAEWLVVLWAWMVTLLLLPLLALPVQWTSQGLWPQGQSKE